MVPDLIPRTLSIETVDITASRITGMSFRFYFSLEWEKFEVFVHTKSNELISHIYPNEFVFMPLSANDEILWLQLRSNGHAPSLMVCSNMSHHFLLTGPFLKHRVIANHPQG
jgi:hypothetical protein